MAAATTPAATANPSSASGSRAADGEQPCELDAGVDAELAVDVGQVVLDGLAADEQRLGDAGIRVPVGDEARHLELLRGQRRGERLVASRDRLAGGAQL